MRKILLPVTWMLLVVLGAYGQPKDKAVFKEYKPGYYQNFILKDIRQVKEKQKTQKMHKRFEMDQSGMKLPNDPALYKTQWHFDPISQGNTGTCWCFSTTSMYESEVYRLTKQKIKISEIFTVYWEYVEKAKRYVEKRGNSAFEEGSESNAVGRIYKMYGAVPEEVYTGLMGGRKFHDHSEMYKEMRSYLNTVKAGNAWNEEEVVATIKSIMNHYIGTPPESFDWKGKTYTPKQFLSDVMKINPDDYVDILSYEQQPYWEQVEYEVPDNWWHSKEYYNVPLEVFMKALKEAVKKGYTVAIGGDVSEPGFSRETNTALIPDWDIPSEYINDDARQFRFTNHTTTDDHGMHLVGWLEKDDQMWYLIKDSSSGSRNVGEGDKKFGYYFFSSDYVKLKMMDFAVHKDAVKDILKKFK
jgi:bleomycin hydrolase